MFLLLPSACCLMPIANLVFSQERFLALKPTADSGDGTPNYKFPFFGLLTIGTIGTERSGGTFGTASASTPLDLPANGRPAQSHVLDS
jgi:hypothetical protein